MAVIDGVGTRRLLRHEDDRGSLTEILRSDWPEFRRFGQALLTVNRPGVVRAWHWHERQTDAILIIAGQVRVALYDARTGSRTYGTVEEHVFTGDDLVVTVVPPGVWHGYKTVGRESATILNFPDQLYDPAHPDEGRAAADAAGVPYDWEKA